MSIAGAAEDFSNRYLARLTKREQRAKNRHMHLTIACLAEGTSKCKRHLERPRHANGRSDLGHQCDGRRDDPAALDLRLDQTDGLVAHRSDRRQQRNVDAVSQQEIRRGRCRFAYQASRRRDRAHE